MYDLLFVSLLWSVQGLYSMDIDTSQQMTLSQVNWPKKLTLYSADKTISSTFDVIDSLQHNPEPFVLPNKNSCWLHAYGYHGDAREPSVMEYCSSGEQLRCFVRFDIPTPNGVPLGVLLINFAEYPYLLKAILDSKCVIQAHKCKIYYFSEVKFENKDLVLNKDPNKSNRIFSFLEKDDFFVSDEVWQVILAKINGK
jgi:hypothetical protein